MATFTYQPMLPLAEDSTAYRLITRDFVTPVEALGKSFVKVETEAHLPGDARYCAFAAFVSLGTVERDL